jgi:transposase InsO family protein
MILIRSYIGTSGNSRVTNDLLMRVTAEDNGTEHYQVVVSKDVIPVILDHLHNRMGHPGRERTTFLVMDRFYWPRMRSDIAKWIDDCERCLKFKTPDNQRASMVSVTTSQPLELVCMDFLTLEPSKGGIQNVLVITDHFTKFAVAVPTRNQTARTTADALFNHFIIPYGLPKKIHSDQGANFSSKLIQELRSLTGISKSRTTPYHPKI